MKKLIKLVLITRGLLNKIFYQVLRIKRLMSSELPKKQSIVRNSHGFPIITKDK